jgi:hypothetical protein
VLVAALIGVPITGLAGAAVLVASSTPSTAEQLDVTLGRSAAMLESNGPDIVGMHQDPVDRYRTDVRPGSPLDHYFDDPAATTDDVADPPTADVQDAVPAGVVSIAVRQGEGVVTGPQVPVTITLTEGQTWAGALDGHWQFVDGRAPRSDDEVLVTPATLERLHTTIGQGIELTSPGRRALTVVGTLRDLGQPTSALGVFGRWGALGIDDAVTPQVFLPDHSVTWAQIERYNDHGIIVASRAVALHPPFRDTAGGGSGSLIAYGYLGLAGAFALFEVGLLAAAAFLVSSRADTRTHAVLASVGGDRRFLFAVVSLSGLVLGVVGAVGGTLLGAALGTVAFHVLDDGNRSRWPGVHLPWLVLVGVVGLGVVAGWVASLVAARSASRVDVDSALRGATRPSPPPRRRWTVLAGPALTVVGIAMTLACGVGVLVLNDRAAQDDQRLTLLVGAGVALGPCLAQLGVVLAARRLLGVVARVGARFGLSARIAVRDAVRNPVRTVPVLASVMSVVFVATVLATFTAARQAQNEAQYEYSTAAGVGTSSVTAVDGTPDPELTATAVRVVRQALPDVPLRVLAVGLESGAADTPVTMPVDVHRPDCRDSSTRACSAWLVSPDTSNPHVLVGTADDLAVLIGHEPSRAARDALARGGAVTVRPEYVQDGRIRFESRRPSAHAAYGVPPEGDPLRSDTVPAVVEPTDQPLHVGVLVSPATAGRLGISTTRSYLVASLPGAMPADQADTLAATWQTVAGPDRDTWYPSFTVETGPSDDARPVALLVVLLAAVVTLGATIVSVGLARADGRRDDEVLDAIGASPRIRRQVSTWQAGVLTLVGAVVGVLFGVLPLRALTLRFTPTPTGVVHMPFAPDPLTLLVLAVGLPLLVTAGVWLVSGRRRRVAVRRTA